jgi:Flp pilus assembly protein TadG
MNIRRQGGTTTVEFAIIGMVAMLCLLGVIEVSRLLFTINTLGEATRRGARLAAVCPVNDPAIAQMTVFNSSGGTNSPIINGLSTANVQLEYLLADGTPMLSTTDFSDPANFGLINYVRVQIVNYVYQWIFPGGFTFAMPPQPSTFPRESLGVPRNEPIQPC